MQQLQRLKNPTVVAIIRGVPAMKRLRVRTNGGEKNSERGKNGGPTDDRQTDTLDGARF